MASTVPENETSTQPRHGGSGEPSSNGARPAGDAAPPATPSTQPKTVVCLPTYDERDNVEAMLLALGEVLDTARDRVLVIDDASPDGTGEAADRLASELDWVAVLHRERKEGLGPAYLAGFGRAVADGADFVVTIDCDFSHDPGDVPRLIEAAGTADLVIGSRYVAGGEADPGTARRRLLSRTGCLYARSLLGVEVRDLTAGFKCIRREALERIDLDGLSAQGYGFHIELTYRALCAGLSVREIPIRFGPRRAGRSKMTGAIAAEAAWKVPALRLLGLARRP